MLLIVDLDSAGIDLCPLIAELRGNPQTLHLPIVAFSATAEKLPAAQRSGANVTVDEAALLTHLPQLLEEALRV